MRAMLEKNNEGQSRSLSLSLQGTKSRLSLCPSQGQSRKTPRLSLQHRDCPSEGQSREITEFVPGTDKLYYYVIYIFVRKVRTKNITSSNNRARKSTADFGLKKVNAAKKPQPQNRKMRLASDRRKIENYRLCGNLTQNRKNTDFAADARKVYYFIIYIFAAKACRKKYYFNNFRARRSARKEMDNEKKSLFVL